MFSHVRYLDSRLAYLENITPLNDTTRQATFGNMYTNRVWGWADMLHKEGNTLAEGVLYDMAIDALLRPFLRYNFGPVLEEGFSEEQRSVPTVTTTLKVLYAITTFHPGPYPQLMKLKDLTLSYVTRREEYEDTYRYKARPVEPSLEPRSFPKFTEFLREERIEERPAMDIYHEMFDELKHHIGNFNECIARFLRDDVPLRNMTTTYMRLKVVLEKMHKTPSPDIYKIDHLCDRVQTLLFNYIRDKAEALIQTIRFGDAPDPEAVRRACDRTFTLADKFDQEDQLWSRLARGPLLGPIADEDIPGLHIKTLLPEGEGGGSAYRYYY